MKRIVYSEHGGSSVLRLAEAPIPVPGPGEVLVRMHTAGVNPIDWKTREGARARIPEGVPEWSPGNDGAGVVEATGERVWTFLLHHEGRAYGTYGEHVVVPERCLAPLPEAAGFELGASLGTPAVTAHAMLTYADDGHLAPGSLAGRTVLVHGGAGQVGHFAVQLARWAGATVVTTVSGPAKAVLATAAGAHHVVNYREPDAVERILAVAPGGVDWIVETAPVPNSPLDVAVIKPRGVVSICANDGGDDLHVPVLATYSRTIRYQFLSLFTVGGEALARAAAEISAALADGALSVGEEHGLPVRRFALADAAAAQDAVKDGVVGKVLLDIAG